MNFDTIIPFILPSIALFLSVLSIFYTWHQNRQKIDVDIGIETNEDQPMVKLCAINTGYRPVALIKCRLLVNDKPIKYLEGKHNIIGLNVGIETILTNKIDFPFTLKEGGAVFLSITAQHLNGVLLLNKLYSGTIELSGYYETAQRKKIHSKSKIKFDTNEYGIGKIVV
jgi:hypothetical protein